MGVYRVTAIPWQHGWELHITDRAGDLVGVTQSDDMEHAVTTVRDYLDAAGREDCDASLIVMQ